MPPRSRRQIEFVHIGDRALVELRQRWQATQRSSQNLSGSRGGSATFAAIGAGVTAPSNPPELTKFDDALRVREYLGDEVMELDDAPDFGSQFCVKYLAGEATFHALFVRGDPGYQSINQIAYVARIESYYNGTLRDGLIFLLGAYARSTRFAHSPAKMTVYTPSSPEGLRYAFHISRGKPPETFDPVRTLDNLAENEKGELAFDTFLIAAGALEKPKAVISCRFVGAVHGVLHHNDARLLLGGPASPRMDLIPEFVVLGAPLVLAELPDERRA